jgi:hypothetical protein
MRIPNTLKTKMKLHATTLILCHLILLSTCPSESRAHAPCAKAAVIQTGTTELVHKAAIPVKFSIHVTKRVFISKQQFELFVGSGYPFGVGDNNDDLVVSGVTVRWGKQKELYLSPSSYSDLFNPSCWSTFQKGDRMVLTISGGDAASSYSAELEVMRHGIVLRKVFNRISGYEETTQYRYPQYYVDPFIEAGKKETENGPQ